MADFKLSKKWQIIDDILSFFNAVKTGDDKGINVTNGQFSVGSNEYPNESIFGSGDSYPVPLAFHCDVSNTVGGVITSAIDITSVLESDTGSVTGLYGGVTAGKYLLVGSDYKFPGIKLKKTIMGNVEPQNIVSEYLITGTTWGQVPFMATGSNYPYEQCGWNTNTGLVQQINFGFNPLSLPMVWEKATLNINGTNYEKYWGRFRIMADITADAIVEQIKLHTNRTEIENDGFIRMYGRARVARTLLSGVYNSVKNDLADPANEVVRYTDSYRADYVDNEFANNTIDGFGLIQGIDHGLDTSIPLVLGISYYVKGTMTGDVNFTVKASQVDDGFVYNGAEPYETTELIENVAVSSNLIRKTVQTTVMVNKLAVGDGIVIEVKRDATSGNPNDTLNGNIVITNVTLTGYFWHL